MRERQGVCSACGGHRHAAAPRRAQTAVGLPSEALIEFVRWCALPVGGGTGPADGFLAELRAVDGRKPSPHLQASNLARSRRIVAAT